MPTSPFLAPERDDRAVWGRPSASGGTDPWTVPGRGMGGTITGVNQTADRDYYEPLFVVAPIIITVTAAEVTSALAGNLRLGLYRADRDLQPLGAPLMDSGNIDTSSTGVKTYTPSTPLYLPRGRYVGVHNSSAAIQLRGSSIYGDPFGGFDSAMGSSGHVRHRYVGRTFAAFPTPGTAWDSVVLSATPDMVQFYRVATP